MTALLILFFTIYTILAKLLGHRVNVRTATLRLTQKKWSIIMAKFGTLSALCKYSVVETGEPDCLFLLEFIVKMFRTYNPSGEVFPPPRHLSTPVPGWITQVPGSFSTSCHDCWRFAAAVGERFSVETV